MKNKKKLFTLLSLLMVVSILALLLVGCGGGSTNDPTPDPNPGTGVDPDPNPGDDPDPNPGDDQKPDPDPGEDLPTEVIINFANPDVKIYSDPSFSDYATALASRMEIYSGFKIEITENREEARILLLPMYDDSDVNDVSVVGEYSISIEEMTLVVKANDVKAMQFAVNRLYKTVKPGGMKISSLFTEEKVFDNYKSTASFLSELSAAQIAEMTLVDRVMLGDSVISGFSPYTNNYSIAYPSLTGYPNLSARAVGTNAQMSIIQPADNGGVGIITVENGGKSVVYTVTVRLESVYMNASVINKDNTRGTITFVIDDGQMETASFVVNELFPRYEHVNATFAIITKDLATLEKDTATNEWKKDENGNYVYTTKKSAVDFWQSVLDTGRADLTSHSVTHAYWGANDDGGSFNYVDNKGNQLVSQSFPKGNVTAELLASQQILRDLYGVGSNVFVMPGVGAPLSDYYYNLLKTAGFYIGARNTAAKPNDPLAMVGLPEQFKNNANRFNIQGYMIEHYNTSATNPTTSASSNADCLAAGIPYWTTFIDTAIDAGGWACFCIHNIRPDNYVGADHYIYESQADALFAYANSYGEDVWHATLEEATKYYNLRAATTVRAELVDNLEMRVALSDSETSAVYSDVVLTVRVSVPQYWRSASVNGVEYDIHEDEEGKYIILNLARDAYVTVKGEASMDGDDADFEFLPVGGADSSAALPGTLTLAQSTPIYYYYDDAVSAGLAHTLASELSAVSGKSFVATADTNILAGEGYIRILPAGSLDSVGIALKVNAGSLGAYRIYMLDGGICLSATDDSALSLGVSTIVGAYSDGRILADASVHYIGADGVEISPDALADDTLLSGITVGGVAIPGFDPSVREYVVDADLLDGFPLLEYLVHFGGSSVSMSAPTDKNGGVCRIKVSSESGLVGVYTVRLRDNSKTTSAEIVNKGGADGAVTFVFDDGDHKTANYLVNEVMAEYDRVKVTLGIILNRVATLVYDEEGDCWMKDEHGNYIYVSNESEVNFWREIIRNGRVELLSHSYSHAYWGEDDGGGVFEYIDNTGATQTSEYFPKGNVTAELAASKQMLQDLFGMDSYSYILPGLRVKQLSDYYYGLVSSGNYYIGARYAFSIVNSSSVRNANLPSDMANRNTRYNVPALTTQYFAANHNNILAKGLSNETYINNGIDAWERYIDNAINQNGWACFLLHSVIDDTARPSGNDYAIFKSQANALFAYADSYGDRLWIATYDEAQIYYNQWSSATVTAKATDNRIRVDLSHRENGEMYDMAMTVRVNLPDGWSSAFVGGEALEIHNDGGVSYVFVDVTPDEPLFVTSASTVNDSVDGDFELVPVK